VLGDRRRARRFLLDRGDEVQLLQARTRRIRVVRVRERFRSTQFHEMGRHWLRGSRLVGPFVNADFLNWRNGASVSGPEEMRTDLDRRRFRRRWSDLDNEYYGSSGGLDLRCREHRGGERYTLALRRPGRSRPAVVLQRSRRHCASSPRLRRGVATWETSRHVHAYVLRTGRTYRWRGSDPVHTRRWIAFMRATKPETGRVLYARLPGTGRS
jgi:hypothetical protein